MRSPRLRESIAALGGLQLAHYVVPLVTLPYLTRTLHVEGFGKLAFATALVAYFTLATEFGFGWSATRAIAAAREDKETVSRVFWETWMAQWALALAAAIVFAALLATVPVLRADAPLYLAAFLQVLGTVLFPTWLLQGLERMREMAGFEIAGRLLTIPLLLALVRDTGDAAWAAACISAGSLFTGVAVLAWLLQRKLLLWRPASPRRVVAVLQESAPIFWSRVWISTYTTLLPLMLGATSGAAAVAQFSLADRIMRAAQAMLAPVSNALFPRLSFLYRTDPGGARELVGRSAIFIAMCAFGLSVGLWLGADLAVAVLGGPNFAPAASVLRLLAPLPIVVALSNIFGVQIMLPRGLNTEFTRIIRASALAGLVAMVPLCMAFAATGAALSWLGTEVCVTVLMYLYVSRHGHFRLRHG